MDDGYFVVEPPYFFFNGASICISVCLLLRCHYRSASDSCNTVVQKFSVVVVVYNTKYTRMCKAPSERLDGSHFSFIIHSVSSLNGIWFGTILKIATNKLWRRTERLSCGEVNESPIQSIEIISENVWPIFFLKIISYGGNWINLLNFTDFIENFIEIGKLINFENVWKYSFNESKANKNHIQTQILEFLHQNFQNPVNFTKFISHNFEPTTISTIYRTWHTSVLFLVLPMTIAYIPHSFSSIVKLKWH